MSAARQQTEIKARRVSFDFSGQIPKHWLGGKPFLTHMANSFTLVFPGGEKFFIRSIKPFLQDIQDERILKDAQGFIGQEMTHAMQHEKFFDKFKQQGYEVDGFLKIFHALAFDLLEPRISPKLRLAITAGLEHYTALLAEVGITSKVLDSAHPEMARLFYWHAAEEMEHKAVAYEVLQAVDDSYLLRLVGMWLASLFLFVFSSMGIITLLWQDGKLLDINVAEEVWDLNLGEKALLPKAAKIFFEYFKPDFHPAAHDTTAIAQQGLAAAGYQ